MIKRPTLVLTRQETNVLELSSKGMTNAQISKELNISTITSKFHKTNAYKKLGASNIIQALVAYNLVTSVPIALDIEPTTTKQTSLKSRLNFMKQKYAELNALTTSQGIEIKYLTMTNLRLSAELALARKAVTVVALKTPIDHTLPAGKYNGVF